MACEQPANEVRTGNGQGTDREHAANTANELQMDGKWMENGQQMDSKRMANGWQTDGKQTATKQQPNSKRTTNGVELNLKITRLSSNVGRIKWPSA